MVNERLVAYCCLQRALGHGNDCCFLSFAGRPAWDGGLRFDDMVNVIKAATTGENKELVPPGAKHNM
jgi:hypothetical protein